MSIMTLSQILEPAGSGWAVGAFNVQNMEDVEAVINAAEAETSPVIIQVTESGIKYSGLDCIAVIMKTLASLANVPVCVHLDHCSDFEVIVRAIRAGFSSVMIDGSKHPYETNVSITRKVVEVARACGVSVEGELGLIGGKEDSIEVSMRDATLTDPESAARFAEETGVDALAVAIGTQHGVYKGDPKLDFRRLEEIRAVVPHKTKLVLHGGSDLPEESYKRAVELGIAKLNIGTDLRIAAIAAMRRVLKGNKELHDARIPLGAGREAMEKVTVERIRSFGSDSKAKDYR